MNSIEIINEYGKEIDEIDTLYKFINYCVNKLSLDNVVFNVIIIDDYRIHEINKKYRNIDRPTDVISFALEDDTTMLKTDVRVLGDIYISYDKVRLQAEEYNHSTVREICFLAIHGLLHLLGYDHINKDDEDKMFKLQKELLEGYGIKR